MTFNMWRKWKEDMVLTSEVVPVMLHSELHQQISRLAKHEQLVSDKSVNTADVVVGANDFGTVQESSLVESPNVSVEVVKVVTNNKRNVRKVWKSKIEVKEYLLSKLQNKEPAPMSQEEMPIVQSTMEYKPRPSRSRKRKLELNDNGEELQSTCDVVRGSEYKRFYQFFEKKRK